MKLASIVTSAAVIVMVSAGPVAPGRVAAQTAAQIAALPLPAAGPAPRTADGHPDLSGVWWPGRDLQIRPLETAPTAGAPPPAPRAPTPAAAPRPPSFTSLYQPWAAAKARTLGDKDDPSLRCLPVAFGTLNISLYGIGFVGQIIQTPKFVTMLTETYHGFKIIPTDGRTHREDVAPSYRGDSVGHWEGETLVVDSRNFTDTNWMFAEGNVSFHSDALRIVERYRRVDANTIEVDAIVEDPKVLTGPWTVPRQTLRLAPFDQIMEVGCSGTETAALMDAAAKQNYGKK
ncbi:MAG: hypothetical protein ABI868_25775 [Acidobacteriota bacterium]